LESTSKNTGTRQKQVIKPEYIMDDFLTGRESVKAYTVFFDTFMPCATKKSTWISHIARVDVEKNNTRVVSLCTVSDEAFALLLLENSFDRWLDVHIKCLGFAKPNRGSKDRGFQSEIPPRYTSGGIKYANTDQVHSFKGWSDKGRRRFNALFDHVKQDRRDHQSFEADWLESRRAKQNSNKPVKKAKHPAVMTRPELFDSEDDEEVQLTPVVTTRETAADNTDSENDH
jgi:hypothetical protein